MNAEVSRALILAEATARRCVTPCDPALDFEDMRQAARLGALHGLETFSREKGASFDTWIIRAARHAIQEMLRSLDHLRRYQRFQIRDVPDHPWHCRPTSLECLSIGEGPIADPRENDPAARIGDEGQFLLPGLEQALRCLSAKEQAILFYQYVMEMDHVASAWHLGIAAETARKWHGRALSRLRKVLDV